MNKRLRIGVVAVLVIFLMIGSALTGIYINNTLLRQSLENKTTSLDGTDTAKSDLGTTLVPNDYLEELQAIKERYERVEFYKAYIEKNFYVDTSEIDFTEGLIDGLFSALDDPYSVYMNEDEWISFNERTEGVFGGIGIVVTPGDDGLITIVSPIEDTPGERAGLKSGDKIIRVNGNDVFGEKLDEAVKQMKGEPGTDVTLTIYRKGKDEYEVPITRALIEIKSVKSRVLEGHEDIGYIRITSFDEKVFDSFVDHYQALEAQNIKGLVIDLRGNPGGLLNQCIELSDFLIGEGVIVSTKNREGKEAFARSDKKAVDLPITVLIDGGSASASEILTAAIKENDYGTIIGTTTFGKGLVQSTLPDQYGGGLKITTAQYFTPDGNYIHGFGIEPDIVIEQVDEIDPDDDTTDLQLQEAIKVLKSQF